MMTAPRVPDNLLPMDLGHHVVSSPPVHGHIVTTPALSLPGEDLLHISDALTAGALLDGEVRGEGPAPGGLGHRPVPARDDDVDDAEEADHQHPAQAGADDDDGLVVVHQGPGGRAQRLHLNVLGEGGGDHDSHDA